MTAFWRGKRALVTGAGRFIGSHLVEQLVGFGAQVRALVRYNSRGDPGLLRLLPEFAHRPSGRRAELAGTRSLSAEARGVGDEG